MTFNFKNLKTLSFAILCVCASGCKKAENLSNFADVNAGSPPGPKESTVPGFDFKTDSLNFGDSAVEGGGKEACYPLPNGEHFCGTYAAYQAKLAELERAKQVVPKVSQPNVKPISNPIVTPSTPMEKPLNQNAFGDLSNIGVFTNPASPALPPSAAADSPPVSLFPEVNADASKWFVADKSQYYLPLQGMPGLYQHHYKSGEKSGYYFDKSTNQLVKADASAFDMEKKSFDLAKANEIYKMQQLTNAPGWQGIQQNYVKGSLQNAGLSYYYAPTNKNKDAYKYFYEVDSDVYKKMNQNSPLASALPSGQSRVLFDNSPFNFQANQSLNVIKANSFNDYFQQIYQPGSPNAQGISPAANGQTQPGTQAIPSRMDPSKPYGGYPSGTKIYLSGTDCGYCTPSSQAAAVREGAIPVGEPQPGQKLYSMSYLNGIFGSGGFPRIVTVP